MALAWQEVRVACRPRERVGRGIIRVELALCRWRVGQLVSQPGGDPVVDGIGGARRGSRFEVAVRGITGPEPDRLQPG